MQDQRPAAAIEKQIFSAPAECPDRSAGQNARKLPRDAKPQCAMANDRPADALTDEQRLQAAARRLDFG